MIKIDGYAIDAALEENHELEAEVTEFPVESGANVTDHVRLKPRTVTIKGVVSDTPIDPAIVSLRGSNLTPSEEARVVLEATWEAKEPITIETTLKSYDNMIMISLAMPRDGGTGDSLPFEATFREIVIETNQRVVVKTVVIGASKQYKGNLSGKPPGWIGTDKQGRDIVGTKLGPGVDPVYTRADGSAVSIDEARDAATKNDSVLVKYDKDGNGIPVDQRDYVPYTSQQKTPYWSPQHAVNPFLR